jgi:hypothetical protein
MRYVLISLAQSVGVILLGVFGVFLGRWFSRLRSRAWLLGYTVPLLLVVLIAVPRWIPRAEVLVPFKWIMANRTEFAAMAIICSTLLTTPLCRLKLRRQRIAVAVFMGSFTVYFSVLPFLVPAFAYSHLSKVSTTIDADGVCLQSNGYNCGPAAAVTVLRKRGIPAEEGALAIRAHTTQFAGTPTDSLCTAIQEEYGVSCHTVYGVQLADLRGKEPFIAVVRYGFLIDHYVTVLAATESGLAIGDPLTGLRHCTPEEFGREWRKIAILIEEVPTR